MGIDEEKQKKLIDSKLRTKLIIYFTLSIVFTGIFIFETVTRKVDILIALVCLIVGLVIGYRLAKIYRISWDEGKVISKLDNIGIVILAIYLIFTIFIRNKLLGFIVRSDYVFGAGISLTAGIMWGRITGVTHNLTNIFKKEDS